jgi:NADPH-dependent curcumin reductase CurA
MPDNHRILFARTPRGLPTLEDFGRDSTPIPSPKDGQFLVKNLYLALEPYYRNVMKGMALYGAPLKPGHVMYGETLSEVIESRHASFAVGDRVIARGGWQEYAVLDGSAVRKLAASAAAPTEASPAAASPAAASPPAAPLTTALGVLGTPGLTGFVGMVYLVPPRPGQTVVVSAATGPVGSTAGQTARMMGARVVGIAGSAEKCEYAVRELGFATCVNYKTGDLKVLLKEACPDGIDVYFDNVGGDTLAAVLGNLALHAQIVLCGMIGAYNQDGPPAGPHLGPVVVARATVKGLVVFDHFHRLPELERVVGGWIRDGKFRHKEDLAPSLDAAPEAFCRLMRGENFGKSLARIA